MNIVNEREALRGAGARTWLRGIFAERLTFMLRYFVPLAAIGIALPPVLMAVLIRRYSTDIPFWDEWETVPLIIKLHTGGFTVNDFWLPHNEHRMVFPRTCYLLLAKFGGWSVLKEIWANFTLALLSGFIVWRLLGLTLAKRSGSLRVVAMAVISVFLFSPDQGFNWVWGFQLQWFLIDVAVLLALWAISRWPGQWLGLSLGIVGAVVATFSAASGMSIWVAVLCGLALQRKVWRASALAVWSACAVVFVSLYFYQLPLQSHLSYVLHHLGDFARYVFAWLGSPVVGPDDPHAAIHAGMAGGAIFLALSLWILRESLSPTSKRRNSQAPATPAWQVCLPWMMLALFSFLNDGLMGYGRINSGWEQALSDRYTNISNLFWIGIVASLFTCAQVIYIGLGADALVTVSLSGRKRQEETLRGQFNAQGLLVAASALILCVFFHNVSQAYRVGKRGMAELSREMHLMTPTVYHYATAPDSAFKYLYPVPAVARGRLHDLDAFHEGPFRTTAGAR